jgi:hypothetical protein
MFACNRNELFGNVIKPDQASQSGDTLPSSLCGQGFKSNWGGGVTHASLLTGQSKDELNNLSKLDLTKTNSRSHLFFPFILR